MSTESVNEGLMERVDGSDRSEIKLANAACIVTSIVIYSSISYGHENIKLSFEM